jgi:hypothetical protein
VGCVFGFFTSEVNFVFPDTIYFFSSGSVAVKGLPGSLIRPRAPIRLVIEHLDKVVVFNLGNRAVFDPVGVSAIEGGAGGGEKSALALRQGVCKIAHPRLAEGFGVLRIEVYANCTMNLDYLRAWKATPKN